MSMGRISRKIEDLLSAVSFAEEGEFETAREILQAGRRVLLAFRDGRLDRRTLRYAANTCKRINAGLDILYVSQVEGTGPVLSEGLKEIHSEGIDCRVLRKDGCLKQEIIDYAAVHPEVLFVVTESADHLDADCMGKGKKLSRAWSSLRCPLVVVGESAG